MTPVIFRKEKIDGTIVAIFPTTIAKINTGYHVCYAAIGQHGSCSYSWVLEHTTKVSEQEYTPLYLELIRQGYNDLKIYKKFTSKLHKEYTENFWNLSNQQPTKGLRT